MAPLKAQGIPASKIIGSASVCISNDTGKPAGTDMRNPRNCISIDVYLTPTEARLLAEDIQHAADVADGLVTEDK